VRHDDPRIARSVRALATALTDIMLEQPFASIPVQAVLERAQVSRSTFYAHFKDKHDLFLSACERMLEFMAAQLDREGAASRRLAPVAEFFDHVDQAQPMLAAVAAGGATEVVWELCTGHFARMIGRRTSDPITARFLAGALVELLKWWLPRRDRPTAAAMDAMFHTLAHRTLSPGTSSAGAS
jgi:AcrR family transcriptional regulator